MVLLVILSDYPCLIAVEHNFLLIWTLIFLFAALLYAAVPPVISVVIFFSLVLIFSLYAIFYNPSIAHRCWMTINSSISHVLLFSIPTSIVPFSPHTSKFFYHSFCAYSPLAIFYLFECICIFVYVVLYFVIIKRCRYNYIEAALPHCNVLHAFKMKILRIIVVDLLESWLC